MREKVGTCKASFHSMLRIALYLSRGMRFPTFDILTSVRLGRASAASI